MNALGLPSVRTCAVVLTLLLGAGPSDASEPEKSEVLAQAMSAVERGAFNEAVDKLELLADQGFVHRDASLARAYAYVERARSRAAKPGDLGRSVAALEEARRLGPEDESIDNALERVRAEIARRRARESNAELLQRPALGRAVVGILPENVWAILAAVGSALLTVGLGLRAFIRQRGAEIASAVGIASGLLIGTLSGTLAAAARHYRIAARPAVVVAPEARWLDEAGRPATRPGRQANVVPEGSLVYVRAEREGRYRIEWGSLEGWVNAPQVRILADQSSPVSR